MDIKSVINVSKHNICTGCGICYSVCPHNCIEIKIDIKKGVNQSFVDVNKCTNCGICIKSCPPYTRSNSEENTNDKLIGKYKSVYSCYSNNEEIRKQSASGGFITTLSIYLIEKKLVDGIIITKRSKENPIVGIPFIATTKQALLESMTSIYAPVEFGSILKPIIEDKGYNKRLAIVGLPCHIEAVHQATHTYKRLKEIFLFKISILCGQSPNIYSYKYIFNKLNIKEQEIISIKNRGDGWPGFVRLKLKNKKEIKYPYQSKLSMGTVLSSPLFTPTACQLCVDPVGFSSDITVSDAWLKEYKNDKIGRNLILIRSKQMQSVIENMINDNFITVKPHTDKDFYTANKSVINKVYIGHYFSKILLGKKYNTYNTKMKFNFTISFLSKIRLRIFALHLKLITKVGVKKIMPFTNSLILFYLKTQNLVKQINISSEKK